MNSIMKRLSMHIYKSSEECQKLHLSKKNLLHSVFGVINRNGHAKVSKPHKNTADLIAMKEFDSNFHKIIK
jgi:hypothetical protein